MNSFSILHNIFHSIVLFYFFTYFRQRKSEREREKKIVSSCANYCEPTNVRLFFLRVHNVFFCLLSFWCFTLEWTLLAFRRYEYDARYYSDHPLLLSLCWTAISFFRAVYPPSFFSTRSATIGQTVILLCMWKYLAAGGLFWMEIWLANIKMLFLSRGALRCE